MPISFSPARAGSKLGKRLRILGSKPGCAVKVRSSEQRDPVGVTRVGRDSVVPTQAICVALNVQDRQTRA